MPIEKPFTYQYIIDRWADGLKILAVGNSGGLLASGAAFQFSAHKTEIVRYINGRHPFILKAFCSSQLRFLL